MPDTEKRAVVIDSREVDRFRLEAQLKAAQREFERAALGVVDTKQETFSRASTR